MKMKRSYVIACALALISVPSVLALGEATSFYVRNATNGSIVSSGHQRDYLLYVPRSYDARRPTPLVISMHGAGLWAKTQMDISRWNELADKQGFIVVYPNGSDRGGPRIFHVEATPRLMEDVLFISSLIDTLSAHYNIDARSVYADGLSNGGGMAFALSCTLSDRIAAVGMVASAQTLPFDWCPDEHPVPVIAFHGTADPITPYRGGSSWAAPMPFPDMKKWMARWARRNQCDAAPQTTQLAADVRRDSYMHCVANADVVFYTLRGGGHTWPGGGPLPEWMVGRTSRSISATALMWQFFRQHQLALPQRDNEKLDP